MLETYTVYFETSAATAVPRHLPAIAARPHAEMPSWTTELEFSEGELEKGLGGERRPHAGPRWVSNPADELEL